MNDENPYISTYSGLKFHILGDDPAEINIHDIAHATSMQCRYTGHTVRHYSVAMHQIYVSNVVRLLGGTRLQQFDGLMHDAAEAYMSDIAKPWKSLMPEYEALEARVDKRIRMKYGLPEAHDPLVKQADTIALFAEAVELFREPKIDEWPNVEVYHDWMQMKRDKLPLTIASESYAEYTFAEFYNRLRTRR